MSDYEYTDKDGDKLAVNSNCGLRGHVSVNVNQRGIGSAVSIPNADAPTVAAELLKAAGHEGVFIPKSSEEVEELATRIECGSGPEVAATIRDANPSWLRNRAANCIALAEWIENKEQRETEAATKLQERRDALANELSEGRRTYSDTSLTAQAAIDRIIELEDGK